MCCLTNLSDKYRYLKELNEKWASLSSEILLIYYFEPLLFVSFSGHQALKLCQKYEIMLRHKSLIAKLTAVINNLFPHSLAFPHFLRKFFQYTFPLSTFLVSFETPSLTCLLKARETAFFNLLVFTARVSYLNV